MNELRRDNNVSQSMVSYDIVPHYMRVVVSTTILFFMHYKYLPRNRPSTGLQALHIFSLALSSLRVVASASPASTIVASVALALAALFGVGIKGGGNGIRIVDS